MALKAWLGASALALAGSAGAAWACADPGCEGGFNLIGSTQSCQGMAMLAPGNDSRINLMLLLADKGSDGFISLREAITAANSANGSANSVWLKRIISRMERIDRKSTRLNSSH